MTPTKYPCHSNIIIAIGTNIGKPLLQIAGAISQLKHFAYHLKISRIYSSTAMYNPNQPDFLNAVITAKTTLPPLKLLKCMQNIERKFGKNSFAKKPYSKESCAKKPCSKNQPRAIDLDLIAYNSKRLNYKALTLPHPLCHKRLFVMLPLSDISNKYKIKTIKLRQQNCTPLILRLPLK